MESEKPLWQLQAERRLRSRRGKSRIFSFHIRNDGDERSELIAKIREKNEDENYYALTDMMILEYARECLRMKSGRVSAETCGRGSSERAD